MSLPEVLAAGGLARPGGPALRVGGRRWTWGEVAADVRRLRAVVDAAGLPRASRVVVPTSAPDRTALRVLTLLGAGLHAVPLDSSLPRAEQERRASSVGARAVWGDELTLRAPSHPPSHAPDVAALLVFTSGTTGSARAVVLPLAALVASVRGVAAGADFGPGDVWLSPLPLSHVGGLGVVLRAACVGAEAALTPGFDVAEVAGLLQEEGCTHASFVARMVDRLLDQGATGASSLRCVLVGGGRTEPDLLVRARAAGIPAVSTYGLSEAGSTVTLHRPDAPLGPSGDAGWPLPGRELRVVGDRIEVGGPSLMAGYDDGPAVGPWHATGDRGELLPDGRLRVLDRRTDLVVTGGENVSPAEVEAHLASVDGVEEVAVLGLPHPSWGQELVAVLRWTDRPHPERAEQAAQALAPWQRPRRWYERRDPLPRTALGKLRREELRRQLQAADPSD